MKWFSMYSWRHPIVLVYMLQNTEYDAGKYLKWYWQTQDFSTVIYRRKLHHTRPAKLLLLALYVGMLLQIVAGFLLVCAWWQGQYVAGLSFGLACLIAYPVVWAHLVLLPLVLGRVLIIWPKEWLLVRRSRNIFANFQGAKVAIAGSYGKTSMKELLLTVLSQGHKKVVATPANKNVAVSHAYFAQKLSGHEDMLLIEFGEGKPGDVRRFAQNIQPTHAIITGLAPAHLDKYKTLRAAGKDIFSVAKFVQHQNVFVNAQSPDAVKFTVKDFQTYSDSGALGWKVSDVKVQLDGTRFSMCKGAEKLDLHSGLLGRHQVGPIALAAAMAHDFGLTKQQITDGVRATKPYEHRMQPYQLAGAWVIDDSYNGNIDGIRAGVELLKELPAKRKIYVTPGLVDQGADTPKIHQQMGKIIATAQPDMVVLMQHSVTQYIQKGLEDGGFKGELLIESDPLNFYQNLQLFVASGDLVMLQNDWPDNYN